MKLLFLKQIKCLSFIWIQIIPGWLEHVNRNNVISGWKLIQRWVSSIFTCEGALTFFILTSLFKVCLSDPCLRMVSNVQCLAVKYTTNMTIDHIILIWFNWVVEVITWNGIDFLPGATNCEPHVCISCKLSLSSLTGSASIVRLVFWFYQFVSFYVHSSKNVRFSELNKSNTYHHDY